MTDNVKLDLYNAIETALKEIAELKHVLKYNSQDKYDEKIIPKQYPQAWIHFSSIDWNSSLLMPHNKNQTQEQKGIINITIHIEQFSLSGNETTWKPDLNLVNNVYRKLTNLKGENFTQLQRISETDDIDNNNIRDWQITFSTMVVENGVTEGHTDVAPVSLIINKQII
ncbi:MAG: hypothetical protein OEV44_00310 [Spirochaetota bacterium]|nr:hypothetical protein [Spirochaetota bacterium]